MYLCFAVVGHRILWPEEPKKLNSNGLSPPQALLDWRDPPEPEQTLAPRSERHHGNKKKKRYFPEQFPNSFAHVEREILRGETVPLFPDKQWLRLTAPQEFNLSSPKRNVSVCVGNKEFAVFKIQNENLHQIIELNEYRGRGWGGGGGVLPHMGYVGMCRPEGYGFQAVYSGIGYVTQRVWV